jgi:hypothetical protein
MGSFLKTINIPWSMRCIRASDLLIRSKKGIGHYSVCRKNMQYCLS